MSGKKVHIVVVGGSLAGLMHGIVAKRLGHKVTILEQYPSSQREEQAAGIVTLEFLHKYLMAYDELQTQPYAVFCQGVQSLDKQFNVRSQYKMPMRMSSWNVLYHRLRANFDGLQGLYCERSPTKKLTDGEVVYRDGQRVTGVSYTDGSVKVTFEDARATSQLSQVLKADLVIAADGSTSPLRRIIQSSLDFSYAGYVARRGTVLEQDVCKSTRDKIDLMTTLCASDRSYIAIYTIPGENCTLVPGKRLINYVWYTNLDESDLSRIMTDNHGHRHRQTLPIGKMRSDVWARQKKLAAELFPEAVVELVNKTTQPFVSAIRDIPVCTPSHFDGKLLFVGDALCAFRPHVASSMNQAAYDALLLAKLLKGEIDLAEWSSHVVDFSHRTRLRSITWGDWYQQSFFWFLVSKGRSLLAEYYPNLSTGLFGGVMV